LALVQQGSQPFDWKPMSVVGSGVIEIRVHAEGEFRVFYVAKFDEAVYVLHVFVKKTRKTSLFDIELDRKRYVDLQVRRKQ
jgi:phage-related protein